MFFYPNLCYNETEMKCKAVFVIKFPKMQLLRTDYPGKYFFKYIEKLKNELRGSYGKN